MGSIEAARWSSIGALYHMPDRWSDEHMSHVIRYKGKTPVKQGQRVDLLDHDGEPYETIKVRDALATQFTVTKRGRVRFFFYEDRNVTWRPAS
jgi:hypothetical protein